MSTGPPIPGPPAPTGQFRETNGLAIGALITGIIAIVPVAIVLGIVALVQIKRRGDAGRGLAIAGIAIACGWVVAASVAITFLVTNLAERDSFGNITKAGYVTQEDLVPGVCLNDPSEHAPVLHAVRCDEPHDSEVFARFELKSDGFPGDGSVRRRAAAGCRHRLADFVPDEYDALIDDMTYFSPDRIDWAIGDRDVTCFANLHAKRTDPLDGLIIRARRQPTGPVLY